MHKKIFFIILILIISVILFSSIFFIVSNSFDKNVPDKDSLNITNGTNAIYATRNSEEKTAELYIRKTSNLKDMDRNSRIFINLATTTCFNAQRYYHNKGYYNEIQKKVKSLEINKSEEEEKIDLFVEGYFLKTIKIEYIDNDDKKVFTCNISGPNKEDNLIGLFSEDGTSFSFRLNKADEYLS